MPETDPLARKSRFRMPIWGWLLLLPVLCVIVILVNLFLFVPKLEIGPETTVILGPLKSDGTPNYIAALDQKLSEGVTPENNAFVKLLEAFGPETFQTEHQARAFEKLGIPMMPKTGSYLVDIDVFIQQQNFDSEQRDQAYDAFEMAGERTWSDQDFPLLQEWLTQNEPARKTIIEALQRPQYYAPLLPDDEDATLSDTAIPDVQQTRSAARLLSRHALNATAQGDTETALSEVIAIFRLAEFVSQRPWLINQFVAIAHRSVAVETLNGVLLTGSVDAEQSRKFFKELERVPAGKALAETIDIGERFLSLDMVFAISSGRPVMTGVPIAPAKISIDRNVMLREFNKRHDEVVAAMQIENRDARRIILHGITQTTLSRVTGKSVAKMYLSGLIGNRSRYSQALAEILISLTTPALEQVQIAEDRTELKMQVVPVLFALAAYKTETGTYPESLDQLTPKYIDAIPNDLFTNEPLRYTRTETAFRLYSVGVDGIDQGGKQGQNGDDIPFGEPLVEASDE